MIDIDADLERIRQGGTDISEHIDTLIAYGNQVGTITEFGVRDGNSTLAWVSTIPDRLTCYDIQECACIPKIKKACEKHIIFFKFHKQDTLKADIERTNLLFIDTLHTATQLAAELDLHQKKVGRWIILHDTESFGEVGEDGKPGLKFALSEFLLEQCAHWKLKEHFKNCNGLTILERV